jgi:hypothetical protein
MHTISTLVNVGFIRELSEVELDLVSGADKPTVSFEVNLGNMKVGGQANPDGTSLGWAQSGNYTRYHEG